MRIKIRSTCRGVGVVRWKGEVEETEEGPVLYVGIRYISILYFFLSFSVCHCLCLCVFFCLSLSVRCSMLRSGGFLVIFCILPFVCLCRAGALCVLLILYFYFVLAWPGCICCN